MDVVAPPASGCYERFGGVIFRPLVENWGVVILDEGRAEGRGALVECRKCQQALCSHDAACPTMIRWYDDPWDGEFWRRCECTASIEAATCPVTVRRVERPGR
ncbi:hypothetical protein MCHIJ_39340 [Mycolicibacterium chitae]|nr:hypothetical protein MCHIJ_39340 [Mycolicibacterium chitae]